ncbi:MAG: efflux RND transporter periplasmic adaptor subunit [Pseudomonadota bacterium]|nr:efflux RND transporter periplasmic adaptor subunit [Pseudomonadota bacterium]MDP1904618.1 efflux RND transporter periplasmic adaptor subunit [Pseudomonadota bacterium]MDP2353263.1 efflux RND transporter periplasmic adaptor subunit [Pseudomonadota bacterium]
MHTLSPVLRRWSWRFALLAVAGILGYAAWLHYGQPKPIEVSVAEVNLGQVESSVANTRAGTVKACRRAKLAPQGGGQIAKLRVHEGDRVKAGQVLLELWNADLVAGARQADEQIRTAQARRGEACAAAEAARREAKRQQQLAAQGFVSVAKVDAAVSEADVREAGCRAAAAEIAGARARLETARATLSRSVLKAPFAGIIAEVTGEQGEYSTPSPPGIPTPPAIDLIDDTCLYVTAPIDEVDAPKIRVGLPARIALDAFPGKHFAGRVQRIAPYVLEVEKQARTVEVEVAFTQPLDLKSLLVGYSADAEIILEARDKVLRIPTQALLSGNKVLLLKEGVLSEHAVGTGLANWQHTEITRGLKAGDQVVISLEKEGVKAGVRAVAK